mmetsp:Transcript_38727/g.115095  ORF Transcript_38727/g.115095 Transcript_38727/m.115095 type:complete len:124 (-) Transcript_38727:50-421(-)
MTGSGVMSMYVVNKSGGLVFTKDFAEVARVDLNDSLRLASIWHSLHAIAAQLSPISGCSGIELLEADEFDLHCLEAPTGTKFLLVVEPQTPSVQQLLHRWADRFHAARPACRPSQRPYASPFC